MANLLKEKVLSTLENDIRYKELSTKSKDMLFKELSNIYKENKISSDYPNLYNEYYQEYYHSVSIGPIEEAYYKFINPVLELLEKKSIVYILDIGAGMFVNSGILAYELIKNDIKPYIVSVDKYIPPFIKINHKADEIRKKFYDNNFLLIDKNISWIYLNIDARKISYLEYFDIILHDGFSPYKNPSLWSIDFLNILSKSLKPKGIWVSYTANKSVEASLNILGFNIDYIPSYGRKTHSIRAIKSNNPKSFYKNPYTIPMRDKTLNSSEENIIVDYFLRVYFLREIYGF